MAMKKQDILRIGLNLNAIALMVDDDTYAKIKPRMDEIEEIVRRYADGKDEQE